MWRRHRTRAALVAGALLVTVAVACGGGGDQIATTGTVAERAVLGGDRPQEGHAGDPRGPRGVYAHTHAGMLSRAVADDRPRVYVPNSESSTVSVIDPRTLRVVDTFAVGALPHHVTPSWDLRRIYVDETAGNRLAVIDPETARPTGRTIPVDDPYNLYFTPGGHSAIVVAERLGRLDFRDPRTWRLQRSVPVGCRGVDHLDFTRGGHRALASCEFDGTLVVVDLRRRRVVKRISLDRPGAKPVDVRLSPDGRWFYVADEVADGVWRVDARRFRVRGFLRTGDGTHGLYPSRGATVLYASNRLAGTVSVIDLDRFRVKATWRIPGGSPDMGGVSADGRRLWLSGRYDAEVYVIATRTGRLVKRIPVGAGPHGLLVWPQPGRHSLGHTGNMR
ncbi:MAG TPA: hypothetical protein VFR97_13000 [Capillimicrobium sp.]|nr:hypothetical protein [Capillimicrobium sp.]